jgi:hypothetical protein
MIAHLFFHFRVSFDPRCCPDGRSAWRNIQFIAYLAAPEWFFWGARAINWG